MNHENQNNLFKESIRSYMTAKTLDDRLGKTTRFFRGGGGNI